MAQPGIDGATASKTLADSGPTVLMLRATTQRTDSLAANGVSFVRREHGRRRRASSKTESARSSGLFNLGSRWPCLHCSSSTNTGRKRRRACVDMHGDTIAPIHRSLSTATRQTDRQRDRCCSQCREAVQVRQRRDAAGKHRLHSTMGTREGASNACARA